MKDRLRKIRIGVLFQRFGPYHHARVKALAKYCRPTAVELTNIDNVYAWDSLSNPHPEDYESVTIFPGEDPSRLSANHVVQGVRDALDSLGCDAIAVPGWSEVFALAALQWSVAKGIAAVIMSDSAELDQERRGLVELVKKKVVIHASAGLVAGQRHASYLEKLGIPPSRIVTGYDVVDNDYFGHRSREARLRTEALRNKYDLPGKYFLASGRFVQKKNFPRLLQAYAGYRKMAGRDSWSLVLLGDGPLRQELEEQCSRLTIGPHVRMPGFIQYGELPVYYGLAEAFILASTTEQWGLVVNEAMAAGLPVIVSERCGCVPELVRNGVNGYVFDPGDSDQLAGLMHRMAHGDADRKAMGKKGEALIASWGPDRFATGMMKAAQVAVEASMPNPTLLDRLALKALMYR